VQKKEKGLVVIVLWGQAVNRPFSQNETSKESWKTSSPRTGIWKWEGVPARNEKRPSALLAGRLCA